MMISLSCKCYMLTLCVKNFRNSIETAQSFLLVEDIFICCFKIFPYFIKISSRIFVKFINLS